MEREQYMEVIVEFLASGLDGALIMDLSNNLVDWHTDINEINHDDYMVLVQMKDRVLCDCATYLTPGCLDCDVIVDAMMNTIDLLSKEKNPLPN